jgi:hypothetical protein
VKDATDTIASALSQVARARKNVLRVGGRQVRNVEDRDALKSLALAWFHTHRLVILNYLRDEGVLADVDTAFRRILDAAELRSAKSIYTAAFDQVKAGLIEVRGQVIVGTDAPTEGDAPPDFGLLTSDMLMNQILTRRWEECRKCVNAGANLAAIVMMGGLLEALFVARANKLADKSVLFKCTATPLDVKTKKPLDLRDWTLRPYIDVAHELGWISRSAKDVAAVLRDYRNYVHPEKERSHGVALGGADSAMLWQVAKNLTRQLLDGIGTRV